MAKSTMPTKLTRITEKKARELTTELLTSCGWWVEQVDSRHPFNPQIKLDFLGVADLLCGAPAKGLMLVQLTADTSAAGYKQRSHYFERLRKVKASEKARLWVESGGAFMVIGWRPGTATEFECEYVELTIEDFTAAGEE